MSLEEYSANNSPDMADGGACIQQLQGVHLTAETWLQHGCMLVQAPRV